MYHLLNNFLILSKMSKIVFNDNVHEDDVYLWIKEKIKQGQLKNLKNCSNKELEQIAKMARTFINMQMKTANAIISNKTTPVKK